MNQSNDEIDYLLYEQNKNKDFEIKRKAVLEYCEPHLESMWAARVVSILLGCDFRDAREHLNMYWNEDEL